MNQEIVTTAQTDAGAALAAYAPQVREFVQASKAANTRKAYAAHWRTFTTWAAGAGVQALPAAPESVVAFLTYQATDHPEIKHKARKPATLTAAVAAIAYMHKTAGAVNPCDDIRVTTTMQGIRRKIGTRPAQKAPATLDIVRRMVITLPYDLRGTRDRAIILCGFWGAFRRSELVALSVSDVTFTQAGAKVFIVRSKTDQEGEGKTKQLPALADRSICPVTALREWLRVSGIQSGALFRGIDKTGSLHAGNMGGREVARIVKRACVAAQISEAQYAGHSLRAGFVTDAADKGAQAWEISEQTGHAAGSRVLQSYIRAAGRGAIRAIGLIAPVSNGQAAQGFMP
jgi:integrase